MDMMTENLRPNKAEREFLTLAYNRFYDIFEEATLDSFWEKDNWYRYCKIRDAFAVYTELLHYEPIKWIIEEIKKKRPPMEAEIGSELFKFIRNIIIHMPFFESWDDVWVSENIINWYREGQFIDRFLKKYLKHDPVKYRIWDAKKKEMTYISINFPKEYKDDYKIFLKDILTEKDGVKFSLILMKKVLDTQVVTMK
jgi:hypothetical protein